MRYLLKLSLIFFVLHFFSLSENTIVAQEANSIVEDNERITQLVSYLESKNLDLEAHLKDPRFSLYDDIGGRFRNSAEKKTPTLEEYQRILGFDTKKIKIREFMETYSNELEEAEKSYDIPKYVISAIIGLESNFGAVVGSYNPLNVYVSMYSENYRADFARAQLEELLIFTNERNIDVFELKSSYAGAMAFAQFIPYSLNRWFVGDDIFDMRNNILSVANYLAHFKEITGDIQGAVFRYNPSSLYRDAVLSLADEAEIYFVSQQD
jgi:membrane-bound lytic murein transglycosylase B